MGNSFCIGLDLGTSNSAAAVSFAGEDEIRTVPISQTAGPGLLGEKSQLASACYLPAAHEEALLASSLPWVPAGEQRDCLVGAFAREHGALVPDRLITSAKSWLCNAHVDRRAAILPWKSEAALHKFSPVDVSSMILAHLRDNLHFHREKWGGDDLLKEGQVVLTVPASFDEVARNLTYEAAEKAGWEHVTLLEEPQAAFYAWIAAAGSEWRSQVQPGDIILVCDVGGGTTDFSLIAVSEEDGELRLHRISVGDHILLGGDNMDLALAFAVKNRLQASGQTVGKWQFLSLVQLVRGAKERLFSECALSEVPISIAGRGGSLFRDTISAAITREEAEQVILEGFFPRCSVLDKPQERRAAALQEFGLPYAADAAITKHLARFLTESFKNVKSDSTLASELGLLALENEDTILCPTAVLFNGGVFKAAVMRERILGLLHDWSGSPEVRELEGTDLDLAVARGACYYAKLRAG
ncbi:MAG TPA: Hsp70 family protein [Oligoflexia bacterium]|nr:Hsp70 family protein [Oligoflexia bacterium]